MTRTVKVYVCKYMVRGSREIKEAKVIANNEAEAIRELSRLHGKKGCAFILEYEVYNDKYSLDDNDFLLAATLLSSTKVTM